jgi:hypothetical protein
MSGLPPAPFVPYSTNTVNVAAGGFNAASVQPAAIHATALAAGAIHATAIAADARGQIKRIYRGSTTMTNAQDTVSVTLSPAVDPAKSELRFHGWRMNTTPLSGYYFTTLEIASNGASVILTRGANADWGAGIQQIAKWEVTEYY